MEDREWLQYVQGMTV